MVSCVIFGDVGEALSFVLCGSKKGAVVGQSDMVVAASDKSSLPVNTKATVESISVVKLML